MKLTIKSFITSSGERLSQLYDTNRPGFPLFYPTAYLARVIRPAATHETQKVHLAVIKKLCEWEIERNVDLAKRFHSQLFLSAYEIDDIANHLRASKIGKKGDVIGNSKFNTNIIYAANYICWLMQEVITDSNTPSIRDAVKFQLETFLSKKRKPGSKSARAQQTISKMLPKPARDKLLNLFKNPLEKAVQTQDIGPRIRNMVMLRILYETGMRAGELLSLKLKNFIESLGNDCACLVIQRNHSDKVDTRLRQPVAKTLGRKVPISAELEDQIKNYIINWRAEIHNARFSEDDYIFVVHRAGSSQGLPLTKSALDSGISNIKQAHPTLRDIHPHLLRHDWNYRFSQVCDEASISFEEERTLREQLMGWVPGSSMSNTYNLRHIQEKAKSIGLRVASKTARIQSE